MGQADRDITNKRTSDSFLTPNKRALSSKSKRASASVRRGSLALAGTPGAAPTTSITTHSTASTSKSKSTKRVPVRDQTTLTQIDFVTRSQQPTSDDESTFEYIGDSGGNAQEVIEIEDQSEDEAYERDNEQDKDYKPSSDSRIKRERGVRFGAVPSKPNRSSSGIHETSGKGRRKSGDRKDKDKTARKDDKTLTQMKYVRRINIESDDDEDAKLEYAYITPKKKDSERQVNGLKTEDRQDQAYIPEPLNQHKRRKLSLSPAENKMHEAGPKSEEKNMRPPTTPRKNFKHEIPSSQSPESPGIAFITSSQFRSATRSPEKPAFKVPNKTHIKTEAPGSPQIKAILESENSPRDDEVPSYSSPNAHGQPEITPDARASLELGDESPDPKEPSKPTQRTVVYETDAGSDYSEFDDEPPDIPSSPGAQQNIMDSQQRANVQDELNSSNMEPEPEPEPESQELPSLPVPETQIDSNTLPSQSNLLSDASICYQRLYADTQLPLDPVPMINTQRMAELFPENSHGLHTISPSPSSPIQARSQPAATPQVVTETQDPDQTQDQPESRTDKTPTDIVPESSPVARREDSGSVGIDLNLRAPAARDVVVQVESSQPVDRVSRQQNTLEDSGPRRMLSRSQILTSSVMESILMPPFWMSSQESALEPYPLPD
ncbi:hypothetical protein BDV19DRAFT_371230, partial [Aspergillus venezuelensis]